MSTSPHERLKAALAAVEHYEQAVQKAVESSRTVQNQLVQWLATQPDPHHAYAWLCTQPFTLLGTTIPATLLDGLLAAYDDFKADELPF